MKKMSKLENNILIVLKPDLIKIIAVVIILIGLFLYFYFFSGIIPSYECLRATIEECIKEERGYLLSLTIRRTLSLGIPLSIVAWIVIGLIKVKFRK